MSWSATAYVKKIKVAPNGSPISKGEKLVLFVLADYHNEERGNAWASLRHLAEESLCTRSGLVRTLGSLQKKGVIRIITDPEARTKRIVNRYQFVAIDPLTETALAPELVTPGHQTSDPRSLGLVTPGHQTSDPRSLGLVTLGHHIFPKNLSNRSFQKKEKARACTKMNDIETDAGEPTHRFQEFWQIYPPRNGKRLEQASTKALFLKFSVQDQVLAVQAARNYGESLKAQGLSAKDPRRFLRDSQGHEPWRDWIIPAPLLSVPRPPPPPPKTDPIGRGHWASVYGNPKDHGYS